jgi:hypothetical protein
VTDDAIRERHGVTARQDGFANPTAVTLVERDRDIMLARPASDVALTIWQARYLARKLYRLARRIENRNQESE